MYKLIICLLVFLLPFELYSQSNISMERKYRSNDKNFPMVLFLKPNGKFLFHSVPGPWEAEGNCDWQLKEDSILILNSNETKERVSQVISKKEKDYIFHVQCHRGFPIPFNLHYIDHKNDTTSLYNLEGEIKISKKKKIKSFCIEYKEADLIKLIQENLKYNYYRGLEIPKVIVKTHWYEVKNKHNIFFVSCLPGRFFENEEWLMIDKNTIRPKDWEGHYCNFLLELYEIEKDIKDTETKKIEESVWKWINHVLSIDCKSEGNLNIDSLRIGFEKAKNIPFDMTIPGNIEWSDNYSRIMKCKRNQLIDVLNEEELIKNDTIVFIEGLPNYINPNRYQCCIYTSYDKEFNFYEEVYDKRDLLSDTVENMGAEIPSGILLKCKVIKYAVERGKMKKMVREINKRQLYMSDFFYTSVTVARKIKDEYIFDYYLLRDFTISRFDYGAWQIEDKLTNE